MIIPIAPPSLREPMLAFTGFAADLAVTWNGQGQEQHRATIRGDASSSSDRCRVFAREGSARNQGPQPLFQRDMEISTRTPTAATSSSHTHAAEAERGFQAGITTNAPSDDSTRLSRSSPPLPSQCPPAAAIMCGPPPFVGGGA